MTQSDRYRLRQWRRYEFIRDYGLENAEADPAACTKAMVKAGLFSDGQGRSGMLKGLKTICREMRKGWKPKPIEATTRDAMEVLACKIGSDTVSCINLSPDESALLWSAVQRWRRTHNLKA